MVDYDLASPLVAVENDPEAVLELCMSNRWGDGLPVVPPTAERVREMLRYTDRHPSEVIALLPPGFGEATVERIAINAVLAGCRPAYLPVLVAAVEAVAVPQFNLQSIQVTTNSVTPMLVVNGPATTQLDINGGRNCLGQGWRANATLGRALRLVLQNVGGALPGETDLATHGQPGKYTFCFAENEAASPWEPLHLERGFPPGASTVTVVGASGTTNMNSLTQDGSELLRVIADTLAYPTNNDYIHGGEPWVILCPEHAQILAGAGFGKAEVKRRLWEGSQLAGRRFTATELARLAARREDLPRQVDLDTPIPISPSPDDVAIVVAGGASIYSVAVPTFGGTRSVTRAIADRDGAPLERFGVPFR